MTNKIIFTSVYPEYQLPHPIPASKGVPEWWRKESNVGDKTFTMKRCKVT